MRSIALVVFLFAHFSVFGQLYSTGLVFDDENYLRAPMKAVQHADGFKNLPGSASIKKYCPKPGNQLQLNTSPAWATAWSAKTILDAKKFSWSEKKLITNNTSSPAYTYYHVREANDENCEAGVDLYDALKFLKQNNVKKYVDFLEFCPKGIPEEMIIKDSNPAISEFAKLFESNHPDQYKIGAVKRAISESYPVVIGMYCPPSFYRAKNLWQPNELVSSDYPGHALCVIGYDDNKYGGAFEVINSWGKRWANNGFVWIRYTDFVEFTKYAYEVIIIGKSPEDTFDFKGSVSLNFPNNEDIQIEKLNKGYYKTVTPFPTGTYFRIYLKNTDPSFVYVFGIDEMNKFFRVFPHQEDISAALVYKSSQVAIPGEDNYIEIIGEPGRENLCILYSKEAIDFNQILFNLAKYPGTVYENLDALLEGKMIPPAEISWSEEGIGFTSKSRLKSALFIQIQIDHI